MLGFLAAGVYYRSAGTPEEKVPATIVYGVRMNGARSVRFITGAAWALYLIWALGTTGAALAQGPTEVVLHHFAAPPKGAPPQSPVIRDSAGNLYGTTPVGGVPGAGAVYKVDTTGHETVLYSFTGSRAELMGRTPRRE